MACTTGPCSIRPLSAAYSGAQTIQMGLPLSIILNPLDEWYNQPYTECVVSFIAVLKSTNKLVTVTIGDLLTPNPITASQRTDLQDVINTVYDGTNQKYPYSLYNGPRSISRPTVKVIGHFAVSNPLYITPASGPITYNQVNAGYIYQFGFQPFGLSYVLPLYPTNPDSLLSEDYTVSWQNSYINYLSYSFFPEAPVFASTAEINAITTTTEIMIVGYEQLKQGDCGVQINSVNTSYTFSLPGFTSTFPFNNLLSFTRRNPACGDPVIAKDKGAAILASIGGKWKIIGIVIGFNGATGYGSRIDYIANQLGIEAWDGKLKGSTYFFWYPAPGGSITFKTIPGLNDTSTIIQNNINYKQIGLSNIIIP